MEELITRHSLLQKVADPADGPAWREFVGIYRRFICHILGRLGIDSGDIDDLNQQILIALSRNVASYDRDKAKFRTWLGSIIRNTACSHLRMRSRHRTRFLNIGHAMDFNHCTGNPSELDLWIENEWAAHVSTLAMERVRETFQGQAIEVFEMSLDGLLPEAIAGRTGLTVSSVYTLRKRVKKRLYLEIRALTAQLEP